jgi:tetratricopeptide (TPR) repeat protein
MLPPGPHTLTVEALGYVPVKIELTVGPDESVNKQVTLERLSLSALQTEAASLFASRAYDDVLKLCSFIREAENDNAIAHRLTGLIYMDRGDFANAGVELNKALAANESIGFLIRRHTGEKFDLNKGHDLCNGQLVLSRNEVEFKSTQYPADNFKVSYDQLQVVGTQLKNSVAAYLATKVTNAGKRRDYNFYSYDKERSPDGKPYLQMIQGLLHSH